MNEPVYLDFNATTPVDARVLEVMLPYFSDRFGNAASSHRFGRRASSAVEDARGSLAEAIGAPRSRVVFTSGATESINLALAGVARGARGQRHRIVTLSTEHKAVLDTARALRPYSEVSIVGVGNDGLPDLDELADTIGDDTLLVSVMAANNETGVVHPIREIAAIAHDRGALMHCDATQAIGKIPFSVLELDLDLVSLSSHKIYGPQGVGALCVSPDVATWIEPLAYGGGHEGGLRSGTINLPGCVGLGAAATIAVRERPVESQRLHELRDRLETGLVTAIDRLTVNAATAPRLPGTLNVRVPSASADAVMLAMPHIAVSSGSACTAASPHPSHVLQAMGLSYDEADQCIRFSLGRSTTDADINQAISATVTAVESVRRIGAP